MFELIACGGLASIIWYGCQVLDYLLPPLKGFLPTDFPNDPAKAYLEDAPRSHPFWYMDDDTSN